MYSYTLLVNKFNYLILGTMLLTYNIIIHKYMLLPHLSPVSLSLSLSPFLFPSLFLLGGGEAGHFGGEASPPAPPLDETLHPHVHHMQYAHVLTAIQ